MSEHHAAQTPGRRAAQSSPDGGPRARRLPRWVIATVPLAGLAVVLTACSSGSDTPGTPGPTKTVTHSPSAPTSSSSVPAPAAVITSSQHTGSTAVNPTSPVDLKVADGTLTSVTMRNPEGKKVTGALSSDGTAWHTTEVLGYSKKYRISAVAKNADGKLTSKRMSFSTLTPSNMTMPYFQRIGGYALDKDATYGVGIVPIVHFDEAIGNKAAAERALEVTTSPHVDGSWYWADDQDAHWRPEHYYKPGTKVTIAADVYGVEVGHGLYGQSDISTSFTIGRKQITVADDNAPQVDKVRVYNSGHLVRTMNTSMGKHSGETVNGTYINFYTLDGNYTVIAHENPALMSSASYGLPADAPGGYAAEPIYWSTKISVDGIYLHELDTTVYDQDNGYDVSHGCLNMNQANAQWYYQHSMIGDPVTVRHTGGPTIQVWEGGDWSVPWSKWKAGSALS